MSDILWNCEEPIRAVAPTVDVPAWIESTISPSDVAAIVQGGCASGAYMPAVTYYDAAQTMVQHGDDVLQYLQDEYGTLPTPPDDVSWSGLACFYLSAAVEMWAAGVEQELIALLEKSDNAA